MVGALCATRDRAPRPAHSGRLRRSLIVGRRGPPARPRHPPPGGSHGAYGVPEADIARVLAIDPKTLRKHYRQELATGHAKATAEVAEFRFRKATTDGPQCVTAAIFWMKTRGGWRETPQSHEIAVSEFSQMSGEELVARLNVLNEQLAPYLELKANDAGVSDAP
jgi:ribosomal protein L29